jgi:FixJ family two-component response regulator
MEIAAPRSEPAAPLVVVVDRDQGLRAALRFALEAEGYHVEDREDGAALAKLALPAASACLVIEHERDGRDGLGALEALRRKGVGLPAILITGYAGPPLRARAQRASAEVVEKPLLCDALLTRIHALAPLPRA